MSWHVVGAFDRVNVRQRFGDGVVHRRFKIGSDVGIGVFVNRQRRAGVLDKEVEQAHANRFKFLNLPQNRVGDQVIAPALGRQIDCSLNPHLISLLSVFGLRLESPIELQNFD